MLKHRKTAKICLTMMTAAVIGLAMPMASAESPQTNIKPVGKILFTTSDSFLHRNSRKPLQRKTLLKAGDTVVTGAQGRVQILMADGTKIALHPNSALRIDAFQFDKGAAQNPKAAVVTNGNSKGRSIYRLLKGGFRTITGTIGKVNPEGYEVKTPVATIGVRGTNYSVLLCANDCVNESGLASQNGLYVGVSDGAITVDNGRGDVQIDDDQYAYVGGAGLIPEQLDEAPLALLQMGNRQAAAVAAARRQQQSRDEESDSTTTQVASATDEHGDSVDLSQGDLPPETRFAVAASGLNINASRPHNNSGEQIQLNNNELRRFTAEGTEYQLTGGQSVEMGNTLDLRWGRWATGPGGNPANPEIQTTSADGNVENQQLDNRSLHWITSNLPSNTVLPSNGSVGYTLINTTSPTNNLGDSGTVGSAILNADFNREIVETQLNVDINGREWEGQGTGDIGGQHGYGFGGDFDQVTISGSAGATETGSGEFSGVFGTPDSTGVPIGAGMAYEMNDADQSETINGVVIFGPEPQNSTQ